MLLVQHCSIVVTRGETHFDGRGGLAHLAPTAVAKVPVPPRDDSGAVVGDDGDGAGVLLSAQAGRPRRLTLAFAAHAPEAVCNYRITASGPVGE